MIPPLPLDAGEELRVSLDDFRGGRALDLRVWVPFTVAQVPMPTKRGIALSPMVLPGLIAALQAVEAQARAEEWLGG